MFQNPFMPKQNDFMQQLAQLQQYNQYNQINLGNNQADKYAELQSKIQSLSNDEKTALIGDEIFMSYNVQYEQGLLAFIQSQFRNQYNQSAEGQKFLTELENAFNERSKEVKIKIDADRNQLNELAILLKQNPNLINELKSKQNGEG